jgi:membrane-bound ClpP family serine protease
MSWADIACLVLVIAGIVLFLYGANAYDSVVGYTGIGLFVSGLIVYVALRAFASMTKNKK